MRKSIYDLLLWSGALAGGGSGGGGDTPSGGEEWIGDGNTHIWITLTEERKSPMLGCCPNGTVTVDWGDGTTPDVLTGTDTSTLKDTPIHNYASAGDYVITLTINGEMGISGNNSGNRCSAILRHSKSIYGDSRNNAYFNAVKKIEIGNSVTSIGAYAFHNCCSLASINIPDSVTSIGDRAFSGCDLASITIPDSVTSIGSNAFYDCNGLASITIADSVTSIGANAFQRCSALTRVIISNSVTSIGDSVFSYCNSLASINIPDSVTSIGASAFYDCGSVAFLDFTKHTAVPTLANTNAFTDIAADCEIRVPAALVDEWKAATNWSSVASKIVGV